jgi:cob(I)alamin adenosyltransferase
MTVNLTRIYTKLGDSGQTHLGDMSRVSKLHPRVEAYGTVDELNATLGVALTQPGLPEQITAWLTRVQNDLLDLGADLSVPGAVEAGANAGSGREDEIEAEDGVGDEVGARVEARSGVGDRDGYEDEDGDRDGQTGDHDQQRQRQRQRPRPRLRVTAQYTEWLEGACDEINATLAPLHSFVIPGGTPAAAQLHVCRTVCRRAERCAIAVGPEGNPEVVRYLNRLSDLLFILARAVNQDRPGGAGSEPLWEPGAHSAAGGTDEGG